MQNMLNTGLSKNKKNKKEFKKGTPPILHTEHCFRVTAWLHVQDLWKPWATWSSKLPKSDATLAATSKTHWNVTAPVTMWLMHQIDRTSGTKETEHVSVFCCIGFLPLFFLFKRCKKGGAFFKIWLKPNCTWNESLTVKFLTVLMLAILTDVKLRANSYFSNCAKLNAYSLKPALFAQWILLTTLHSNPCLMSALNVCNWDDLAFITPLHPATDSVLACVCGSRASWKLAGNHPPKKRNGGRRQSPGHKSGATWSNRLKTMVVCKPLLNLLTEHKSAKLLPLSCLCLQ